MTRAASQIIDDAILSVDVGVGTVRRLRARTLAASFVTGIDGLMAIEAEPEESQLHAARARAPWLRPARL